MKALILAGGAGTRLRPITYTSAKQLVPVANKPIIFYGLEHIAAAGIREVGIIVGDTAEEVKAAVGSGKRWGMEITYLEQDAPLGLGHCVLIARDYLGDDDFLMYLGDNLLEEGVQELIEAFEADRHNLSGAPAAHICLIRVPDPSRFGVAELDSSGRVVRLVEKPADPPSDLALVGVYLFDRRIHDAVRAIQPSARGELEITDAIQWLIDTGQPVHARLLTGWWIDTGKLTPLLEANRLILEKLEQRIDGRVDEESSIEGRVVIQAGAEIVRSTVRGPAIIGEGTRVVDSYVGPFTSIAERCDIEQSEIEHSLVMAGSRIIGAPRIVDSLIGREVEVLRSSKGPKAQRLMVGDHSRLELL